VNFTLKQLRYFVAVAEQGSISATAGKLFVSQPALSAALAQLEREFDAQLLVRHKARGVSLTPIGRELVAEARNLLSHAGELSNRAHALSHALEGELAIGCFLTLAPFYLPRLLSGFDNDHPNLQININEGAMDHLQTMLLASDVEIALLYDLELDAALEVEVLAEIAPHALLAAEHPLAGRESISLRDLVAMPMVLLDLPHSRDYFRGLFWRLGIEPQIRYRTRSFELARGMVARGHGYSLLSLRPATDRTYDGGRVRCLPLGDDLPSLSIALAWPRHSRLTRRAEAFREHCRGFFAALDSANPAAI